MKKESFNKCIAFFALLAICITNFNCKKDEENIDSFCSISRNNFSVLNNKEGMIVYSNKYNRYAVNLTVNSPNNIDTQIIGFVCNLSEELKNIGLLVTVSGDLKTFNPDENMTPEIGGQSLYFLETTQIIKKP